jgi:hypothetical protein
MKDLVLYCKSYRRDFLRLKRLYESIQEFNQDSIPFYISTPNEDKSALDKVLGDSGDFSWISDEVIVKKNPKLDLEKILSIPGGQAQAIIKAEFWRLSIAENYLCLDSDCFFIRPFKKSDFLNSDGFPYTVFHQNKELFQLALDRGYSKFVHNLKQEARQTRELFSRNGPEYFCAPAPFIWSAKVWQSLETNFLIPRNETLLDLFIKGHPETLVYGETILKFQPIPLKPIEPLFRVYHFDWQYYVAKRLGETESKVAKNYLGIISQSNWEAEFDYGESQKGMLSQANKRFKRFLKRIQSFF